MASRGEKYRGVAPEANLAIGKVSGRAGITDSAALASVEWAATEVKAKIVNMSFGAPDSSDLDPVEQAVNTLSERTGTLFVAGAGNEPNKVYTPGSADAALTVGAVDKQGRLADFSGSGPRGGDRAAAGSVTRLPLWIERNPGSERAEVRSLRLEMSADDGAHWRAVPVVRTGSGWMAAVPNPRTAGFVSLRAVATDTSGGAVTQTITRAYAVR